MLLERFNCPWFSAKHVVPDHAWVQGPWFDFEPCTWTTLKVSCQRGSKHIELSVLFPRFRWVLSTNIWSAYNPRCETMEIHQNRKETAARVSWLCRQVERPSLANEQRLEAIVQRCLNQVCGSWPNNVQLNLSTMCCIKTETNFEQNYLPFRKSSERENHPA